MLWEVHVMVMGGREGRSHKSHIFGFFLLHIFIVYIKFGFACMHASAQTKPIIIRLFLLHY